MFHRHARLLMRRRDDRPAVLRGGYAVCMRGLFVEFRSSLM